MLLKHLHSYKAVLQLRAALVRLGRSKAINSKPAAQLRLMEVLGSKRAALGRMSKAVTLQTGSERLWHLGALSHVRRALTMCHLVRSNLVARQLRLALIKQLASKGASGDLGQRRFVILSQKQVHTALRALSPLSESSQSLVSNGRFDSTAVIVSVSAPAPGSVVLWTEYAPYHLKLFA